MKILIDLGDDYPATPLSALIDLHEWISVDTEDVLQYTTLIPDGD